MTEISVIIPIYNRVHLLPRVLESIKNQTYKNIEVIVVDDGSTQIINQKSEIINQLIRQENKGAPAARNRGLTEAKGEYVIFWDADVIGEPDMLEKMYGALQENPSVSYAYSNFQFEIFNLKTIFNFLIFKKRISAIEYSSEDLKKNNFIHSTSLIRRKDVVRWDESLKRFQDWDLWLSVGEEGKTGVWVDEYLFTILGGGTMSGWLPRIAYKTPFKWLPGISGRVKKYENAKRVIMKKHNLSTPTS